MRRNFLRSLCALLLLASSGCCCTQYGYLMQCSLELNRVPWRNGNCETAAGPPAHVVNNQGQAPAGAEAPVTGNPLGGFPRFHPVPTRPVFGAPPQYAVGPELSPPADPSGDPEEVPTPPAEMNPANSARRKATRSTAVRTSRNAPIRQPVRQ